jgi:hypothetical protein
MRTNQGPVLKTTGDHNSGDYPESDYLKKRGRGADKDNEESESDKEKEAMGSVDPFEFGTHVDPLLGCEVGLFFCHMGLRDLRSRSAE